MVDTNPGRGGDAPARVVWLDFGDWSLLPTTGELNRGGRYIAQLAPLEERIVVELYKDWPGAITASRLEDRARCMGKVATAITRIRAKGGADIIETVGSRRGYRLGGEPRES